MWEGGVGSTELRETSYHLLPNGHNPIALAGFQKQTHVRFPTARFAWVLQTVALA
jgi:hypothetical protein